MDIGGQRLRGGYLMSNIDCDIQTFYLFLQKKGEYFAPIFIHLVLQNNKKGEIVVTLNNFFNFIVLQDIIEFNKFSLRFDCKINLEASMKKK
jgi:hypothetical protein